MTMLLKAIRGLAILHAENDAAEASIDGRSGWRLDAQPDYYAAALHLGLSEAQAERAERAIAQREIAALARS